MNREKNIFAHNGFAFRKMPFTICVTSGKGGVGKSVVSANMAYLYSKAGIRTLVWDADSHFPNQHLIMGAEPPVRLSQVYAGNVSAETAVFKISENLDLLADMPAAGLAEFYSENFIYETFSQILGTTDYDIIIIDTPAGISENVLQSCDLADLIALVVTDEPTSLLDAYGLIKILLKFSEKNKLRLLINNVIDIEDADEISSKLNLATKKFLGFELPQLGFVPYDRIVRKSILKQELFAKSEEESEAVRHLSKIIKAIYNLIPS